MSQTYHTDIAVGAAANASVFNAPLGTLDAAIVTNTTAIGGLTTTVQTVLDSIILGGAAVTLTNGAAAAAQKVVTVDSSAQFVAGCYVEYTLVGGVVERNTVDTVDSSTQITLITNIGTGGIADNSPVAVIPIGFYNSQAGVYHVANYGAAPGAAEATNTAAINAAIAVAAAAGGGTVQFGPGTYAYDGAINLCETANIKLVGATGHAGTVLECHNTGKACIEIIGSKQITLEDLKIVGDGTDTPAVGIWTGRTDTAVYAAGEDVSQIVGNRLFIYGAFTKALIYNTGAESNWWTQCYLIATNAACMAGVMTDYYNGLGLTPEHTTIDDTLIAGVMCVIDKCLITCLDTAVAYSPIYTVFDYTPEIRSSYLACYGAPAIYLKGGTPGTSVVIRDTSVEGTPTYLIYGDYVAGAPYSSSFRLDLYRFGSSALSAGSSGYSIFFEDNSVLIDSEISQCSFEGNVRFYTIQNSRINQLSWAGVSNPALTIAGDAIDSYIHIGTADTLTISGSMVTTTIDYENPPGAGYLLLAGGKGLAVGGLPGATQQAVIRKMLTASATWSPGEIADGASAKTYVDLTTDSDATWFCQASYAPLAVQGWMLSAYAAGGVVCVTLMNRTGGALTPTGTLAVTAMRITET